MNISYDILREENLYSSPLMVCHDGGLGFRFWGSTNLMRYGFESIKCFSMHIKNRKFLRFAIYFLKRNK